MNSMSVCHKALMALLLAPAVLHATAADDGYKPMVPPSYLPEVVLHVDYGTAPEKIRVQWGGGQEGNYADPACVSGLRIVGDRFYFIDDIAKTIKQFRSPGSLVWETERLPNLHYFALAPDGKVYAAWGTRVDRLSCLDSGGRLVWTVDYHGILSIEKEKELGFDETYGSFGWVNWSCYGLTIVLEGLDRDGRSRSMSIIIDPDGKMVREVQGSVVSTDGAAYTLDIGDGRDKFGSMKLTARDEKGTALREVRPKFDAKGENHLAGNPSLSRVKALPAGGFAVEGLAHLPKPIPIAHGKTVPLEEVMWRLDSSGKVTEEWRFPTSEFAGRYAGTVVGSDGCVYRLVFGETGIDVVRYSKNSK